MSGHVAPVGTIADQARRLVEAGYREIVLTGVDITGYGADLPGRPRLEAFRIRIISKVIFTNFRGQVFFCFTYMINFYLFRTRFKKIYFYLNVQYN